MEEKIKCHNFFSNEEINTINAGMDVLFPNCCADKLQTLKKSLPEKPWFAFDLDDTLHSFRNASFAASSTICSLISRTCDVTSEELRATYSNILAQKTSSAFTDGKSSDTYRKERFSSLMNEHSIAFTDTTLDELATAYKQSLEIALKLKPGAVNLLRYLKAIGKRIVIVTEGPEDAQEWTLKKLGIADCVDALVTSNRSGRTKVDGLFGLVLENLEIEARDVVYVGDSVDRDIKPARAEGILSIEFNEGGSVALDMVKLKVNSLRIIEIILSS